MQRIEPIAIHELIGKEFYIPSYQRGYRWDTQQVRDLLNDIMDFIRNGSKGIYCIQPLVVKPNGAKWDVIDGQQRLTTINIILSCFGADKYSIEYETRTKSREFLDNIIRKTDEDAKANIDFYHIMNTCKEVREWMSSKDDNELKVFMDNLLHKVKFIWYDTDEQNPIEVFTRLNIDKISLTPSELIKALLLNRTNFDKTDSYEHTRLRQQEIASEWDKVENTLQDDQFWLYFHDKETTYDTRIDYIMNLICDQRVLGEAHDEIGRDCDRAFRYIFDYFHTNGYSKATITKVWGCVKDIFDTLCEWYNDLTFYHYIGFLMSRPKESTRTRGDESQQQALLYRYFTEWRKAGMTRAAFKDFLVSEIQLVINKCNNVDAEYGKNGERKTDCRPILLLHNIQTVIQQGEIAMKTFGQGIFYKFPFNLYKKENWDVEHIDSNTTNELTDYRDQVDWLLANIILADDETKKDIVRFCETQRKADEEDRKRLFDEIWQKIVPENFDKDRLDEEQNEKNRLWNYTLLDEGTNRGYGNVIFPTKRRWIMGKDQGLSFPPSQYNEKHGYINGEPTHAKSAFIPLCTKQVFMKYYSPTSSNMAVWTKADAEAYRKNIIDVLTPTFTLKTDNNGQ